MVIITLPPQAQYAMLATKEKAGMASVAAIAANAASAAADSTTVKTRWRGRRTEAKEGASLLKRSEWSAWKLENIFIRSAHFFAELNAYVILRLFSKGGMFLLFLLNLLVHHT